MRQRYKPSNFPPVNLLLNAPYKGSCARMVFFFHLILWPVPLPVVNASLFLQSISKKQIPLYA